MRAALFLIAVAGLRAGNFQTPANITVSRTGLTPTTIITADFNTDGIPDVATLNIGPPVMGSLTPRSAIGVALGAKSGAFSSYTEVLLDGQASSILAADMNHDGALDIVAIVSRPPSVNALVCVAVGNNSGSFGGAACTETPGFPSKPVIGDFNKDGFIDVALVKAIDNTVVTMLGNGFGTFTQGPPFSVPSPTSIVVTDWNGDGFTDLVVYSTSGVIILAQGNGTGNFTSAGSRPATAGESEMALADLNGDGKLDIVATSPVNHVVSVFRGNGTGFDAAVTYQILGGPQPTHPRVVDADGNGTKDVWFTSTSGVFTMLNDGTGRLSVPTAAASAVYTPEYVVGDFNGDGRVDIAGVGFGGSGGFATVQFGAASTTTLTLDAPASTIVYGQAIRLVAHLFSDAAGDPPSGLARLLSSGTEVQTVAWAAPSPVTMQGTMKEIGTAAFALSLPAGSYTLSVAFAGTPALTGSSSQTARITVQTAPSTLRPPADPIQLQRDNPAVFTATLDSNGSPIQEGLVKFFVGDRALAQAPVQSGSAQIKLPAGLSLGAMRGRLVYEGTNYQAATSPDFTVLIQGLYTVVSAAKYTSPVARGSLATIQIPGLAAEVATAPQIPWPTVLSKVEVEIGDAAGVFTKVPLSYAGPNQINLLVPGSTAEGQRQFRVRVDGSVVGQSTETIIGLTPGIFTADGTGSGVPAALAGLYRGGTVTNISVFDCSSGKCVPAAMPLGDADQVLVVSLYGTGLRNTSGRVSATAGGIAQEVLFAGAHSTIPGLDQINVRLSRDLRGEFDLSVVVDSQPANVVRLSVR